MAKKEASMPAAGKEEPSFRAPWFSCLTNNLLPDLSRGDAVAPSLGKLLVEADPARLVYELVWRVVMGSLPVARTGPLLEAGRLSGDAREDAQLLLAEAVAQVVLEMKLAKFPNDWEKRLVELAHHVVRVKLVPLQLLMEQCEADFLTTDAQLTKTNAAKFKQKEVRINTKILYTQTKFNLFREESEGYAKIMTLLSQEGPDALTKGKVKPVKRTIKSLIGFFDLDPNRVCDIILDCYEKQPSNDAFLQLTNLFTEDGEPSPGTNEPDGEYKDTTTPQILGFKFQYYQRPEVNRATPQSLCRLAAKLIKEGKMGVNDIWAHLAPADNETANKEYEAWRETRMQQARTIGQVNLAATAERGNLLPAEQAIDVSVTVDYMAAVNYEAEVLEARKPEVERNQKFGLLQGLLEVEDWPHAIVLLDKLAPQGPVEWPSISTPLNRLVEKTLSSSYKAARPVYLSQVGTGAEVGKGVDLKEHARDSGPLLPVRDVEPAPELFKMLSYLGPYLYRDTLLFLKVCRVMRAYLISATAKSGVPIHLGRALSVVQANIDELPAPARMAYYRVDDVMGICLLPALSMTPANYAVASDVWELLKLFPFEWRYRLYGEWDRAGESNPMLAAAKRFCELDTKRILKRIADPKAQLFKQMGRTLGKVAHANPTTALTTVVKQCEGYASMVPEVVKSFKYMKDMEHDVVEYVLLTRLATKRERLKETGLDLADWLQGLSEFAGAWAKEYNNTVGLYSLVQHLLKHLVLDDPYELVVLQELISQMGNVRVVEDISEDLREAMSGGEVLRNEAVNAGQRQLSAAAIRNMKKSSAKLKEALVPDPKEARSVAIPLLIGVAQMRNRVLYSGSTSYVKLQSASYDMVHRFFIQYCDFVTRELTSEEYAALLPSLHSLVHDFHLEPEVALYIYQPVLKHLQGSPPRVQPQAEGAVEGEERASDEAASSVTKAESASTDAGGRAVALDVATVKLTWQELTGVAHSFLQPRSWEGISEALYIRFWSLSLSDLQVPRARYEAEIAKLRGAIKQLEMSTDNTRGSMEKRIKERNKLSGIIEKLEEELAAQQKKVDSVREKLAVEKDSWLHAGLNHSKTMNEFVQNCIVPRAMMSTLDAYYCHQFVMTLTDLNTPYFSTLQYCNLVISIYFKSVAASCTDYEAQRFGKLICEMLKAAERWKTEEGFEKECKGRPGFKRAVASSQNNDFVQHDQYVKAIWKWQGNLTTAFAGALASEDYMETRNALMIMREIGYVYPVIRKHAVKLEKEIERIVARPGTTEDLKTVANSYKSILLTRRPHLVEDWVYNPGAPQPKLKPTALAKASLAQDTARKTPPPSNKAPSRAPSPSPLGPGAASGGVKKVGPASGEAPAGNRERQGGDGGEPPQKRPRSDTESSPSVKHEKEGLPVPAAVRVAEAEKERASSPNKDGGQRIGGGSRAHTPLRGEEPRKGDKEPEQKGAPNKQAEGPKREGPTQSHKQASTASPPAPRQVSAVNGKESRPSSPAKEVPLKKRVIKEQGEPLSRDDTKQETKALGGGDRGGARVVNGGGPQRATRVKTGFDVLPPGVAPRESRLRQEGPPVPDVNMEKDLRKRLQASKERELRKQLEAQTGVKGSGEEQSSPVKNTGKRSDDKEEGRVRERVVEGPEAPPRDSGAAKDRGKKRKEVKDDQEEGELLPEAPPLEERYREHRDKRKKEDESKKQKGFSTPTRASDDRRSPVEVKSVDRKESRKRSRDSRERSVERKGRGDKRSAERKRSRSVDAVAVARNVAEERRNKSREREDEKRRSSEGERPTRVPFGPPRVEEGPQVSPPRRREGDEERRFRGVEASGPVSERELGPMSPVEESDNLQLKKRHRINRPNFSVDERASLKNAPSMPPPSQLPSRRAPMAPAAPPYVERRGDGGGIPRDGRRGGVPGVGFNEPEYFEDDGYDKGGRSKMGRQDMFSPPESVQRGEKFYRDKRNKDNKRKLR